MDKKYRKIFKTVPKQSFSDYFSSKKREITEQERYEEAVRKILTVLSATVQKSAMQLSNCHLYRIS